MPTTGSIAGTSRAARTCSGARARRGSRPTRTRSSLPTSRRSSTTSTNRSCTGSGGELEDAIYEQTDVDDLRLTLFGGPFFKATDHPYRGRLIPRSYWKLIAYAENTALKAKAFVLT
jgi:endonuclease G